MKKLRFLSFFFCAIAALAFTSCIDDDDDSNNTLTPEQIQTCYNITRGTHAGKLYYPKDPATTLTNNNDTVDVHWTINTDSTMTLLGIPSKVIAAGINNSEIKTAIESQPNVNIPCKIGFFKASDPITWLINPQSINYDIQYNGASHRVQVAFYISTYYSFGQYNTTNNTMLLQIVIAGAYLDGQTGTSIIPKAYGLTFLKRN